MSHAIGSLVVDSFICFIVIAIYLRYIQGLFHSAATGKVLASELPKCGNNKCTVLYPASVKAGSDIGMCNICYTPLVVYVRALKVNLIKQNEIHNTKQY